MDAAEEEAGFRVLIGTEKHTDGTKETDQDGVEWDICDYALYKGVAGILESSVRHYTADFREKQESREDSKIPFARLSQQFPDGVYTYAAHPDYEINPYIAVKTLHGSGYDLYRDNEKVLSFPDPEVEARHMDENGGIHIDLYPVGDDSMGPGCVNPPGLRDCQFWVQDGVVYAVTMVTGYAGNYLFINDRQISPPQPKKDVPPSEIHGVGAVNGQLYAVMHISETKGGAVSAPPVKTGLLVPITADTESLDLTSGIRLDAVPTGTCAADGDSIWFMSGTELFHTEGKVSVRITDIGMCGFNDTSTVRSIRPLPDGRYLMVIDYQLVLLTPADEEFTPTIHTLTIGYLESEWLDPDLGKRIRSFNLSGKNTVLRLQSYQDQSKLNLAILSEEVDILASADILFLRNYADKGILCSLEETVPALFEKGKLAESITEASRYKGKIYMLPRVFHLYGVAVPTAEGLPKDDLAAFLNAAAQKWPESRKQITNEDAFVLYGMDNLDEWIDWENRKSHFDSESFRTVLEYAGGCAKSVDEVGPGTGSGLHMVQIAGYDSLMGEAEGREICMPIPSASYRGYMISAPYYLAAVEKNGSEEHVKEALSFLFLKGDKKSTLISETDWLSINRAELDNTLINREESDSSLYQTTEHAIELAQNAINHADCFRYIRNNELCKVLNEEAGRYFTGEITAKQAAEYIQNRVSIYLAEQG